MMCKLLGLEMS